MSLQHFLMKTDYDIEEDVKSVDSSLQIAQWSLRSTLIWWRTLSLASEPRILSSVLCSYKQPSFHVFCHCFYPRTMTLENYNIAS